MPESKKVLGVIIARRGSTGLKRKNILPILGKPTIAYTIEAALKAELLDAIVLTTDDEEAQRIGRDYPIWVIGRPAELATNTAPIDEAVRWATKEIEKLYNFTADIVVILNGNIPYRPDGIIDMAIKHLIKTGADSVQSYSPVGKFHPDWMVKLVDGDKVVLNNPNHPYRRQDLPKMYIPNGAVIAVRKDILFRPKEREDDFYAFLGKDRRGIVHPESSYIVDIDELKDLYIAEAIIKMIADKKETMKENLAEENTVEENIMKENPAI